MARDQALTRLTQLKPELIERFGIARLALFGSTARNEAIDDSDIDILVLNIESAKRLFPPLQKGGGQGDFIPWKNTINN